MGNATHALMNTASVGRGPSSQMNKPRGEVRLLLPSTLKINRDSNAGSGIGCMEVISGRDSYVRLVENSGKLFDVAAPSKESAARAHSLLAKSQ